MLPYQTNVGSFPDGTLQRTAGFPSHLHSLFCAYLPQILTKDKSLSAASDSQFLLDLFERISSDMATKFPRLQGTLHLQVDGQFRATANRLVNFSNSRPISENPVEYASDFKES